MKILVEKVWDFLSKFTDNDGAFDYMLSVDDCCIVVKSLTGFFSSPVIKYFVSLQSSMSDFIDCGFYITLSSDNFVTLRFYIKRD